MLVRVHVGVAAAPISTVHYSHTTWCVSLSAGKSVEGWRLVEIKRDDFAPNTQVGVVRL